jgi:elongation factor 1-beta
LRTASEILEYSLLLQVIMILVLPSIPVPEKQRDQVEKIPPRLAKLVMEKQKPPPPPPPPKEEKKEEEKKEEPKEEPKKEEELDEDDLFGSDDGEDAEAAKKELEKKAADAKKKKNKPKPVAKSLVILEVKPWGPEIDLDKLGKKICKEVKMEGLEWKTEFKKEPVAFGVFKIVIGCVVEDEKVSVDDVQEQIEGCEDEVQSVDIAAFNKL